MTWAMAMMNLRQVAIPKPPAIAQDRRKCKFCGDEFAVTQHNKACCSNECRNNLHALIRQDRLLRAKGNCIVCGGQLPLGHKVTCGKACRNAHRAQTKRERSNYIPVEVQRELRRQQLRDRA